MRGAPAVDEIVGRLNRIAPGSSQLVLVTGEAGATASAVLAIGLEKEDGAWRVAVPAIDAVIGSGGFAEPGRKREGDMRTPSGVFPLERTFGYQPSLDSKMPYRQVTGEDVWVDDVNADDYNRPAKKGETRANSFEKLKLRNDLYRYLLVVEYNTRPVVKGMGSAIFFHTWAGPGIATSGCIAMPQEQLMRLLRWLDPAKRPVAVMGQKRVLAALGR
ncbi:L,D-transpeptidase family protein [Geomonas sp. Red32]|uniref:L,D-transpeptidase family protein n=1 Tax=Geomonas sp. Red32 TaxID=2912856 RepID=UPI00202CE60D|nr:L,D-transpeptidase family protein [Geomonas sp. Red32]MCM0082148.1 L,D-transpeptidase family protein [Geomonas sp. Red32]